MQPPTAPRAHRDRAVVDDKCRRRFDPHVKPLNELAEEISKTTEKPTPWFDPDGGGIHARALFLLETPGRKAGADQGSHFISADNDDPIIILNQMAARQKRHVAVDDGGCVMGRGDESDIDRKDNDFRHWFSAKCLMLPHVGAVTAFAAPGGRALAVL